MAAGPSVAALVVGADELSGTVAAVSGASSVETDTAANNGYFVIFYRQVAHSLA
ncbi:hypothetical protein MSHI_41190 [Mycobacterium shinjukuense]|uniref:Uncharacterized protein n=1 Tax=Mycobacterium shinjukuense TaxID=398694 RepID=A0A7I7MXI4_9MYCO|nr:hypothetical protein MSHI_41190 [Mycobacterium shinjukuense]